MNRSAQMMIHRPECNEKHSCLSTAVIDSYREVIA